VKIWRQNDIQLLLQSCFHWR